MTTADVPRNECPPFRLADEEKADLFRLIRDIGAYRASYNDLLAHVTDLCAAYHAAGLVEGDLGHDGTIRAEVEA